MLSISTTRLLWKEYRQQRALLLTLVFCASVVWLLITNAKSFDLHDESSLMFLLVCFYSIPFLFALGCGATLFAGEREQETLPWLTSLPLTARETFWVKFGLGCICLLTFASIIMGLAQSFEALISSLPTQDYLPESSSYLLLVLQVLGCTAICSCLCSKVIISAVAGGFSCVAMHALFTAFVFNGWSELEGLQYSWILQLIELVLILGLCSRVAPHWWQQQPADRIQWRSRITPSTPMRIKILDWLPASYRPSLRAFLWLQWQEVRRAWWFVLAIYFVLFMLWNFISQQQRVRHDAMNYYLAMLVKSFYLWSAFVGACTFALDQQACSFRFFTEHGISARRVWFGRVVFWLAVATIPFGLVSGYSYLFQSKPQNAVLRFEVYRVFRTRLETARRMFACFKFLRA
jgi:ABC-type transport system involved in multi-copper enzyme maturation permease subunit